MPSMQQKLEVGQAMESPQGRRELAYAILPTFKLGRDYQAHGRKVLLEDVLDPGEPMWYEKDPQFDAVALSKRGYAPYVVVEGDRVILDPIPVSCWVKVPIEETATRRFNILDREQVKARAKMAEQEDILTFRALNYAGVTATGHNTIVTSSEGCSRDFLNDMFEQVQAWDIPVANIIMSAAGTRDMRSWGREEFGPTDQETLRKAGYLGDIWGAAVRQSKIAAQYNPTEGTRPQWVTVVGDPEFSGVFSVRIDLEQMDATDPEALAYGWLFYEFIHPAVIIPQGVCVGRATGTFAART